MKSLVLVLYLSLMAFYQLTAQTKFVIEPSQSMIMTGKGTGQDATTNPFFGKTCFAVVKNIGTLDVFVRVQQNGKIIEELTIIKDEEKKVKLLKGYELYLDPNPKGIAKASVAYERIED